MRYSGLIAVLGVFLFCPVSGFSADSSTAFVQSATQTVNPPTAPTGTVPAATPPASSTNQSATQSPPKTITSNTPNGPVTLYLKGETVNGVYKTYVSQPVVTICSYGAGVSGGATPGFYLADGSFLPSKVVYSTDCYPSMPVTNQVVASPAQTPTTDQPLTDGQNLLQYATFSFDSVTNNYLDCPEGYTNIKCSSTATPSKTSTCPVTIGVIDPDNDLSACMQAGCSEQPAKDGDTGYYTVATCAPK